MNIIILGAGRVGESVAESLVSEQNDITVVDMDPARLRALEDKLDLRGVVGNGIQPSVLRNAGAKDADMVIACAAQDETNLVVCKVAHDVFNVPTTIARLRSPEFTEGEEEELLSRKSFSVSEVICPEESVTRYIHQLISYPEALQVLEFGVRRRPCQPDRSACQPRGCAGGSHHWRVPRALHALRDARGGPLPARHRDGGQALHPHPCG